MKVRTEAMVRGRGWVDVQQGSAGWAGLAGLAGRAVCPLLLGRAGPGRAGQGRAQAPPGREPGGPWRCVI